MIKVINMLLRSEKSSQVECKRHARLIIKTVLVRGTIEKHVTKVTSMEKTESHVPGFCCLHHCAYNAVLYDGSFRKQLDGDLLH